MKPHRVLVVDDEAPARSKVIRLLGRDPRFEVQGEARNGREGVQKIAADAPDLLILDVQMPGLTGFEVVTALEAAACPCPEIVFSTAYDTFAVKAFETHAVDYLLKPYDAARFQRALDRAAIRLEERRRDTKSLEALVASVGEKGGLGRLLIRVEDAWVPIPTADVSHVRADGKFVQIKTASGFHMARLPLRTLEARLDPRRFARIHRGDLVNLDHIARLEGGSHGDGIVVMKDGSALVLSRTHRAEFLRRWGGVDSPDARGPDE